MRQSTDREAAKLFAEWIFHVYHAFQRQPIQIKGPKVQSHGFHILYLLARSKDKCLSTSFLLTELQTTKQQMSKLINELEEFGFIERVRADDDRRNVFVQLTEAGDAYFTSSAKAAIDAIEAEFSKQPIEKTELVHMLLKQLLDKA